VHKIVLLHVAKTAGTAVQSLLRSCFTPSSVIIRAEADRPSGFANIAREMGRARFVSGHICYQEGLDLCDARDWRFGITLRDPIARTLSNLRYYLRLPRRNLSGQFLAVRERLEVEPFHEYLRRLSSPLEIHNFVNLQTRFLLDFEDPIRPLQRSDLELAKRRLASIDHLFLTEQLEESVQLFCDQTGIPERMRLPPTNTEASERRLTQRPATELSPELHDALAAVNSLDLELWSFAVGLLRSRRAAQCDSGSQAAWIDTCRAAVTPRPPYTIDLADGPRSSWHWTGFDYGIWSSSGGGEPRAFPIGRLPDAGDQPVAWIVQSPASLLVTVPSGGPWRVTIEIVSWLCFRSLADLAIRVDGHVVAHRFAREANGSLSLSLQLLPGLHGPRKIDIETAPLLHLDEFSEFPGLGPWLDLPRASLAIRSLRVSVAPEPLAQSAAEKVQVLSTVRGPIDHTFDLRPEEVGWLLPAITPADYLDPGVQHIVVRTRNTAGIDRLEWQRAASQEPSAFPVPLIAVALNATTGEVVSGCLLRDLPGDRNWVAHLLPGETVPDQLSLVVVDPTTGQCVPRLDAVRFHDAVASGAAP
jgi:hypothetical protein